MKILIRILCLIALISGFVVSNYNSSFKENRLTEIIANNNYVVVDVRTKKEYQEKHLDNTINIPYDEISSKINIPKKNAILIYCDDYRSEKAYNYFTKLGYEVYELKNFENYNL